MINSVNAIKLLLSLGLFVCLFEMPYGYYQVVRFIALLGFSFLAYKNYESKHKEFTFIYAGLAILFQPFLKISLGRELWNIIDVIVGIGMIVTIFIKQKEE